MTPVAFDGCFGWLHAPKAGACSDVAVLICPGLMQDALLSHRSLRLFADELAEAGYTALRFDYPGTGDSCDEAIDRAGGHWRAWQASAAAAADWLRATSGARRLVMCGLRLGATLATLAAARRSDVAGLVLLAPVLRGRSYALQVQIETKLQEQSGEGEGLAFREFHLSPQTLAEMGTVDLRRVTFDALVKVAFFPRAESRLVTECRAAWSAMGLDVESRPWAGLEPMLAHDILDEAPLADFSAVLAWLGTAVPPGAGANHDAVPPAAVALTPPGCIETPLSFGGGDRLFGMLCRPALGQSDDVVVIVNGGRDPHYGASRQAVSLARRLAGAGVASLRMDFAGLGDSAGAAGKERMLSPMFADRVPDLGAAVDALGRLGFRRFAAAGLCAGAYHVLQGALEEEQISTLLLINLPLFSLPDGRVLDYLNWRGRLPQLSKLLRRRSWSLLLRGEVDVGGILRERWRQLRDRIVGRVKGLAIRLGIARDPSAAHRALARLSERGARTLFLFSPDAGEIDAFAQEFGPTGAGLDAYPGAILRIVPGMDHDLLHAAGRRATEALMIDFVLTPKA